MLRKRDAYVLASTLVALAVPAIAWLWWIYLGGGPSYLWLLFLLTATCWVVGYLTAANWLRALLQNRDRWESERLNSLRWRRYQHLSAAARHSYDEVVGKHVFDSTELQVFIEDHIRVEILDKVTGRLHTPGPENASFLFEIVAILASQGHAIGTAPVNLAVQQYCTGWFAQGSEAWHSVFDYSPPEVAERVKAASTS